MCARWSITWSAAIGATRCCCTALRPNRWIAPGPRITSGPNPSTAFATTARELGAVFREEGALTRTVHHPIGDRDGAQLLAMRVVDLTVHAWDLARALGADDTLDADSTEFALAHVEVIDAGREHGSFAAPAGAPPREASAQTRLLHLTGRSIEGDRR